MSVAMAEAVAKETINARSAAVRARLHKLTLEIEAKESAIESLTKGLYHADGGAYHQDKVKIDRLQTQLTELEKKEVLARRKLAKILKQDSQDSEGK